MKKYEMIKEKGTDLFRIKALRDFGNVKKGDIGGLIAKEENLSHNGNCWVAGNAQVSWDARVYGDAIVHGNAQIYVDAQVYGDAIVHGNAQVRGDAQVCGNAVIYGNARISDKAVISENAEIYGNADVFGNAEVGGDSIVTTDVLTFSGIRDHITVTDRHATIGCQNHTHAYWKKHIKEIGKKGNYTDTEIKEYTSVLNIMIRQMKRQLKNK